MGESNPAHFRWLSSEILAHRHVFSGLRQPANVFGIAEQGTTPPLETLLNVLGGQPLERPPTIRFFDLTPTNAAVERLDINKLDGLPSGACDAITLFRASVFIRDPLHVLSGFQRILRPSGVAVVDWLHGHSDYPVLDLGPGHQYTTTYLDDTLRGLPAFDAFLEHVRRPPRWRHLMRAVLRRLRHPTLPPLPLLGKSQDVAKARYPEVLRRTLEGVGKNLLGEKDLAPWFDVQGRAARYFYEETRTFSCWALTFLRRR
jgi:SAM-dependent methyltransferase